MFLMQFLFTLVLLRHIMKLADYVGLFLLFAIFIGAFLFILWICSKLRDKYGSSEKGRKDYSTLLRLISYVENNVLGIITAGAILVFILLFIIGRYIADS